MTKGIALFFEIRRHHAIEMIEHIYGIAEVLCALFGFLPGILDSFLELRFQRVKLILRERIFIP